MAIEDDKTYGLTGKQLTELADKVKNAGGGGGGDWDENDSTAPGYIKNRTHYASTVTAETDNVDYLHDLGWHDRVFLNNDEGYSFISVAPIDGNPFAASKHQLGDKITVQLFNNPELTLEMTLVETEDEMMHEKQTKWVVESSYVDEWSGYKVTLDAREISGDNWNSLDIILDRTPWTEEQQQMYRDYINALPTNAGDACSHYGSTPIKLSVVVIQKQLNVGYLPIGDGLETKDEKIVAKAKGLIEFDYDTDYDVDGNSFHQAFQKWDTSSSTPYPVICTNTLWTWLQKQGYGMGDTIRIKSSLRNAISVPIRVDATTKTITILGYSVYPLDGANNWYKSKYAESNGWTWVKELPVFNPGSLQITITGVDYEGYITSALLDYAGTLYLVELGTNDCDTLDTNFNGGTEDVYHTLKSMVKISDLQSIMTRIEALEKGGE